MNTPKRQTAVAWLAQKIREDRVLSALSQKEMDEVIAQALKMEKRQIVDAWQLSSPYSTRDDGKQYYTETYGPLPDDRGETNQTP